MRKKLRLGMIGGGQGAFIGAVHRIASRIDDRYELVAGCLSSTPEKALVSAKEIGLDPSRSYPDFKTMAEEESKREDCIEVVSVVTPNHMHAAPSITFLEKNIRFFDIDILLPDLRWVPRSAKNTKNILVLSFRYSVDGVRS